MLVKCERCLQVIKSADFPTVKCDCGHIEWIRVEKNLCTGCTIKGINCLACDHCF